ncbi:Cdc6-like AAA superfamily ATPase [Pseudomonas sp. URIL14HWK12:I3]|uniref:ATP-binding protein n=1 Tax=unclassified Pseudomonas TaxID=196821 RepID=UPI000DB44830|nr:MULTISPECIES: ATP-binding protein [unclassified Pseudomonas]PZW48222.1 Cdc6-like AAA superfamily ATPase [Pseudomonas sp. URIL14HWK12:I2]PZW56719.1 Cdc6-like AAA superfamily ATPase [Pseudomonas sp. URIL14HWK12:I3]
MNPTVDSRFHGYLDLEGIRDRITVRPQPVDDLQRYRQLGADVLSSQLKKIYLPTQFSLDFIHEMLGRANLHHREIFSDQVTYNSGIFNPPINENFPICLTGLAGVGKSRTIQALLSALPPPVELSCGLFQGVVELNSFWYASARGKTSGKQILLDFLVASGKDRRKAIYATVAELLDACRSIANRHGVSIAVLDEMQFISIGESASRVTDILINAANIGMPLIFVSNYSLIHKLWDRNSEDTQRLLAEPRIMLPDDPTSQDWINYVGECIRVSGDRVDADHGEFAAELYRSTAGLKRLVIQLLKHAYMQCFNAGRDRIQLVDLYDAYRSSQYSVSAHLVENLQKVAIGRGSMRTHADLMCRFAIPAELKPSVVSSIDTKRAENVRNQVIDSALTPQEAQALEGLLKDSASASILPKSPRAASPPKASASDLVKNFGKHVEKVRSPTKPK